jgi:hypothetical protein
MPNYSIIVLDQTTGELRVDTLPSALAVGPVAHLENPSSSSHDAIVQANLNSTQNLSVGFLCHMFFAFADTDTVFCLGSLCEYPEFTHYWWYFCE